jgi:DNA polymerase V
VATKGYLSHSFSKFEIKIESMSSLKIHTGNIIDIYSAISESELSLPYVSGGISAGFPSPALDFIDLSIDLNKHLIKHPSATFYGRVKGNSLKNAGISDGDLLVIDRSLSPANGKIAVCYLDGEFTAKRIKLEGQELWLMPENEAYQPIKVEPENNFTVWGVVTHVIKSF